MKKQISISLTFVLLLFVISGCGKFREALEEARDEGDIDSMYNEADKSTEGEMREEYFEDGQLKKRGRWVADESGKEMKHGLHEVWYEDGKIEGEYRYMYGMKHGVTSRWHDNGIKAYECTFEDDKPRMQGCRVWLADGTLYNFKR